ncbi:M57 family metalloprotease [Loigolactobacillus zhaoyuanensis]|uniref:M57 family metalloprotease n=1 Tax=Loigolactobacillus zhaoyuanensis TaxID=2486017 RepID=UPI000F741B35
MSVRFFKGLLWAIILLAGLYFFTTNDFKAIPDKLATTVSQWTASVAPEMTSDSAASDSGSSSMSSASDSAASSATTEATPLEANVQGKTLASTYYYHFDDDVPTAARQVFAQAIATYNQTGIVKLVAGTGTAEQNQITFSIYHKTMTAAEQGTIELGHGGPKIIQRIGWGAYTANHATASLNATYTAAFQESVAVHELGHALGLDHSTSQDSVMYPVDQGKTALTAADIAGLNSIYNN